MAQPIFYNACYPLNIKQDDPVNNVLAYQQNDIIDFKIAMRSGRTMKAGSLRVSGNLLVQKFSTVDSTWHNVTLQDHVYIDPYVGVASFFRNCSTSANGSVLENIQYLPRITGMSRQANYTLEGINTSAKCLAELCGTQNNYMLASGGNTGVSFSFAPNCCINKSNTDLNQSKFQELRLSFNMANAVEALYTTYPQESIYMTNSATAFTQLRYSIGDVQCRWVETLDSGKNTAPVIFQTISLITQTLLNANSFFAITTPTPYNAVSLSFIQQTHRNSIFYNNNRCEYIPGLSGTAGRLEIEINGNQGPVKYPLLSYTETALNYWKSLSGNVKSSIMNSYLSCQGNTFGIGCAFVQSQNDRVSFALQIDPSASMDGIVQAMDAFIYISGLVAF